jgi:O-antigen ligase/Tfp pilus assembly protein PilF
MNNTYKSFALFIVKAGLYIVPLIPLYISQSLFFPYITGKAFVFRALVEIAFTAWVFLAIFWKEYRPQWTTLVKSVTLFILVVTLATIFAVNPLRAFWSNFERMEGLVAYLHLFMYFLVLGHVFKKSDWIVFFNLFVLAGLAENIYALIQKLGYLPSPQGGFRVDGTIGNPTYLAAYLIFIAAFSGWLFLQTTNKFARYFYGVMVAFSLLTIYFTATRGAAVALVAGGILGIGLYLWLMQPKTDRERWYRKLAITGLVLILLGSASVKVFKDSSVVKNSEVLSRFAAISFSEARTRFTIWSMAWQGVKERPLLGWGPEGFVIVFPKYYKPSLYAQEPWFDRSHNIVFDWLINAGILGLFAYLSVLATAAYVVWKLYKERRFVLEETILLAVLLVVYFLQNLFVFDQLATYMSYFAVLAYLQSHLATSASIAPQSPKDKQKSSQLSPSEYGAVAAIALLAPLALSMYFINAKPYFANKNLLNALKVQNTSDFQGAYVSYEKALSYGALGAQEAREQLARFSIAVGGLSEVDAAFKDKILRRTLIEVEKGVRENALDPRAYLFAGMVYGRVGLNDQAIAILHKALELSPQKQQIYFELADAYLKKGDNAEAVRTLEKTFNDAPRFEMARINLAAAYIINNEQAKADQLLIDYYGTVNVPDDILVQAYSAVKNYPRLLGIWQALVERDPSNTRTRVSLAGAYLLTGQKEMAIQELETAIALNPQFKAEGEVYIAQIRNAR